MSVKIARQPNAKMRSVLEEKKFDLHMDGMKELLNKETDEIIKSFEESMMKTIRAMEKDIADLQKPRTDLNYIITEVLKKIPKGQNPIYEISPPEALKKEFLTLTKEKILNDISSLEDKTKIILKYLESVGRGVKTKELVEKAWLKKIGGINKEAINSVKELESIGIAYCDTKNGIYYGKLKDYLKNMLSTHGANEQEIETVYNHVIYELLDKNNPTTKTK